MKTESKSPMLDKAMESMKRDGLLPKTKTPKASVPQSPSCPYTVEQVLANLRNCAQQLEAWPESLDAGPGYVLGILKLILANGIHETTKVEVRGGVAELTQCPEHVTVTIQDHDNEATGH